MRKYSVLFLLMLSFALQAKSIDFIPKPASVEYQDGEFIIEKHLSITGGQSFNISYLKEHLFRVFEFDVPVYANQSDAPVGKGGVIAFSRAEGYGDEGYEITVDSRGITVISTTDAGEFYAIQTILQMLPPEVYKEVNNRENGMMLQEWSVPFLTLKDSPRFEYRGYMLDVSRINYGKDAVIRQLDEIAYHKINKFHFHLTDDQGWRIEIKKYPKLHLEGAFRGLDEKILPAYNTGAERYGGYFTQKDLKEIVKYAADRHIEIIPEIDLPGHSKAMLSVYPEYLCKSDGYSNPDEPASNVLCVSNEKTFKFIDDILKEITPIFPCKYFHIGGDEVDTEYWSRCPDCQKLMKELGYTQPGQLLNYFTQRMEKLLEKYDKCLAGWEEINIADIDHKKSLIYAWTEAHSKETIDKGFPTIVQTGEYLYLDMKYTQIETGHTWACLIPTDRIYNFEPVETLGIDAEHEQYIKGVQANLWTEYMLYPAHFTEYQNFPRLCAFAELGWSPRESKNYADFDKRLSESHFARMYNMGIRFRLPYPEISSVAIGNGLYKVTGTIEYPNMTIRYTTDGTNPTGSSPVLNGELITSDLKGLRFAGFFNDYSSIVMEAPGAHNYLSPKTTIETSFKAGDGYQIDNLTVYDPESCMRTKSVPKNGDYVTYIFDEPVNCSKITIQTGHPHRFFWGVAFGHAEISYDGVNFEYVAEFDKYNKVIINNITKPVKAVKIICHGPGEGRSITLQPLKIE